VVAKTGRDPDSLIRGVDVALAALAGGQ